MSCAVVKFLHDLYAGTNILYGVFIWLRLYFKQVNCCRLWFVSGENIMDMLYIALIVGFVALSVALARYFETLRRPQ